MGTSHQASSPLAPSAFDRAALTYGLVGTDFFSDLGHCLVRQTRVDRGAKVLDVGAGTGAVTLPAAASSGPGGRVTAIDASEPMLRRLGAQDFGASSAPVVAAVMDATKLGIRDSSEDAVVSGLVLSSLPRPDAAMHEICRVLRPGGRLGFSVAPGWWWQEDPRWTWHAELVDRVGVSFAQTPSSGGDFARRALAGQPLRGVDVIEEIRTIRWGSWAEFWAWCWSHGWRGVLERLTGAQLAAYRTGTEQALEGRSSIEGRIIATLVTATRR
jgi:ubiquinone/menaquinone biosynthesis C-methylase UbiE